MIMAWRIPPLMRRWKISGLELGGDLLHQVYYDNVRRLVPLLAG